MEVYEAGKTIRRSAAAGTDKVASRTMNLATKAIPQQIATALNDLFTNNNEDDKGQEEFKMAKLLLLFKRGSEGDLNN